MPSPQGPLLPRRRLGAELRRLRGHRTLEEVTAETLISTSKLSRLENGQGVPQPRDIRDLINFYEADKATADRIRRWATDGRRQAWWKEFSDVIPESFDPFLDFESGASAIRTYMPMALPGLLQTEGYARRLITTLRPHWKPEDVDKLVQLRLRRQQILLNDSDDTTQLMAVIDEAAVRRALFIDKGGRSQLAHLHDLSGRRNISIRILPLHAGLHPGVMSTFTVLQFSDDLDRDVVHIELHTGDRYLEEHSSVLEHLRLFDSISHRALDVTRSRDLLAQLIEAPRDAQEKN